MNGKVKMALLFLGLTAALAGGYFAVTFFVKKKKDKNSSTDENTDTGEQTTDSTTPAPDKQPDPKNTPPATLPGLDYTVTNWVSIKKGDQINANSPTTLYKDSRFSELVTTVPVGGWVGVVNEDVMKSTNLSVTNYSVVGSNTKTFYVGPRANYRVKNLPAKT